MKKHIQMIAVAGAMAAASGSAVAADPGAFFINGNLGQSTYHDGGFDNNTDTSGAIRAGYSWQSYKVDFGVEGGYVDLGRATGEIQHYRQGTDIKEQLQKQFRIAYPSRMPRPPPAKTIEHDHPPQHTAQRRQRQRQVHAPNRASNQQGLRQRCGAAHPEQPQ